MKPRTSKVGLKRMGGRGLSPVIIAVIVIAIVAVALIAWYVWSNPPVIKETRCGEIEHVEDYYYLGSSGWEKWYLEDPQDPFDDNPSILKSPEAYWSVKYETHDGSTVRSGEYNDLESLENAIDSLGMPVEQRDDAHIIINCIQKDFGLGGGICSSVLAGSAVIVVCGGVFTFRTQRRKRKEATRSGKGNSGQV